MALYLFLFQTSRDIIVTSSDFVSLI